MRALLDTHALLWWIGDDPKLSPRARDFIRDPGNSVYLSVVSAWEIILKARTGRSPLSGDVAKVLETQLRLNEIAILDLQFAHLTRFYRLPAHHRDPFDQILIAQAQVENLPLLTGDAQIAKYDVEVIW